MSIKRALFAGAILSAALATAYAGQTKYTAVCNTTHSLSGSWWGPDRDSRKDAEADAKAHRKAWPDHNPEIFERERE